MTTFTENLTPLIELKLRADIKARQPNAAAKLEQTGKKGDRIISNAKEWLNQVAFRDPARLHVVEQKLKIPVAAPADWANLQLAGKRCLFLLPSEALGSNTACLLFLRALLEQKKPAKVGVFCSQSTADIYALEPKVANFPLWITRNNLKTWDYVFDFGQVEARRDIETNPVDMELELLEAFGLSPASVHPSIGRHVTTERPKIGIFPLASSPLRTLPPSVTLELANTLKERGEVTVFLNQYQGMGRLYQQHLDGRWPDQVKVHPGFNVVTDLLCHIAECDYVVMADSGPAHITKLFNTPGLAVYTSAHADVLQGRFSNLTPWQVPYKGPFCEAPCGLAKLRANEKGEVGCMGSLNCDISSLPFLPKGRQEDVVRHLLIEKPVPCVGQVILDTKTLVTAVIDDLQKRQSGK